MKKFFQHGVLKLKLLGFGVGTLLASWAGVQHLETERVIRIHEKQMALERELQLKQKVSELNQQVIAANQQIQQKNAQIQMVQSQLNQQRSYNQAAGSAQAGVVHQSPSKTVQQAPQSGTVPTVVQKSTMKPDTRTKAS